MVNALVASSGLVLLILSLVKFEVSWINVLLSGVIVILSVVSLINNRKTKLQDSNAAKKGTEDIDYLFQEVYLTSVNLEEDSAQLKNASAKMSEVSTDLKEKSKRISALIESLTAALEETSSGTSEIVKSTEVINSRVERMNQEFLELENGIDKLEEKVRSLSTENELAGRSLFDLEQSMKRLSDSSESINRMIQVIEQIAEQTNLLALNAAIEAARAGESGKGFAVVAEEVRKLAEQSKRAALDISGQVETISNLITESVEKNLVVSKALQATLKVSEHFAEQLAKIKASTESFRQTLYEIKQSVQNQVSSTQEIELAVNNNVQSSSELAAFADETQKVVDLLSELSNKLSSNSEVLSIKSLKLRSLTGAREWLLNELNELIKLLMTQECRSLDWSVFEPLTKNFLAQKSDVYEAIFIADSSGNFVTTTGVRGNIADRQYFNYLKNGQALWTISDPLKSRATGNMVLTFAYAIREDGKFKGIAGANLRLERLRKELKDG